MSNLFKDGKVTNAPGYGTTNGKGECRYADTGCTEIDWFATHPRPVEKGVAVVEKPITPAPSVEKLPTVQEILATKEGTVVFKGEDGTKIQATTPLVQPPVVTIPFVVKDETAPSGSDVPQV